MTGWARLSFDLQADVDAYASEKGLIETLDPDDPIALARWKGLSALRTGVPYANALASAKNHLDDLVAQS